MRRELVPLTTILIILVTTFAGIFAYQAQFNNLFSFSSNLLRGFNIVTEAKILAYFKVNSTTSNLSYISISIQNNASSSFSLTNISISSKLILTKKIPIKPSSEITVYVKVPFNISLNKVYTVSYVIVNEAGEEEVVNKIVTVENVSVEYLKRIISVEIIAIDQEGVLYYSLINLSPYPIELEEVILDGVKQSINSTIQPLQIYNGFSWGYYTTISFKLKSEGGEEETITQNVTVI